MVRKALLLIGLAAAALSSCGRKEEALTPLAGVGGNPYCVSDADEAALTAKAATDAMATWILIHHYQMCETDTNRAATLLKMQMARGDAAMMDTLADFNRRIELGRELGTKSAAAKR